MGIEPTSEAWEASILPLYDARSPEPFPDYTHPPNSPYSPVYFHPRLSRSGLEYRSSCISLEVRKCSQLGVCSRSPLFPRSSFFYRLPLCVRRVAPTIDPGRISLSRLTSAPTSSSS